MRVASKIVPCLWFDGQALEAAEFYTAVFPESRIVRVNHFTEAGHDVHGRAAGSVMTVAFEIAGQLFTGLNGGPHFKFNEAVSFEVNCETQAEIDYYWAKLSEGGRESQCGWLKDKFGVSWQVVPARMADYFPDGDPAKAGRAMEVMLKMKKLDIAVLEGASGRGSSQWSGLRIER